MRDDIHKSSPVSRAWQTFMKNCAREADRKERACEAAEKALLSDFKNGLSPRFIEALLNDCGAQQTNMFPEMVRNFQNPESVGGVGSVIESKVLGMIKSWDMEVPMCSESVIKCLCEVVAEHAKAQYRTMSAHWLQAADTQAREAVRAASAAISNVNTSKIVREILFPKQANKKKRTFDFDADLRGGN